MDESIKEPLHARLLSRLAAIAAISALVFSGLVLLQYVGWLSSSQNEGRPIYLSNVVHRYFPDDDAPWFIDFTGRRLSPPSCGAGLLPKYEAHALPESVYRDLVRSSSDGALELVSVGYVAVFFEGTAHLFVTVKKPFGASFETTLLDAPVLVSRACTPASKLSGATP